MKNPIVFCAVVIALLNIAAPFCPDPRGHLAAQILSVILGLALVFLGLRTKKPISATPTAQPSAPAPRPEAEIVSLLALLQEHGRLVDFAKEDISTATDQQLGSAARVVHSGCKKVLDEYFEIAPFRTEKEGAAVTLDAGFDAEGHRLLGSVPENPPYRGKLLHPGWVSRAVKLPRIAAKTGSSLPVIAPAEIEICK